MDLLTNGKTSVIKGFKNKEGKSYDAALKFDDNFSVVLDFAKNPKKKTEN
jgi:DNA topoisomerase-3